MEEYQEVNPVSMYKLQSVVFVKGKKSVKEDGNYVTFVNRTVKEDKDKPCLWMKFQKNKHALASQQELFDCKYAPQICIYHMLDEMPLIPEQLQMAKEQNNDKKK